MREWARLRPRGAVATLVAALALGAPAAAPPSAHASELVARSATQVRLEVDVSGAARVSFRSGGRIQSLVARGAVDARPPARGVPQVAFAISRGASIGPDVCGPYTGPPLAWLVVACTHPDGTHWALQAWHRMLPNYGLPASGDRAAPELRLSHWTGPLAVLEIETDWSYRGRFDHLWGRFTYRGAGVYGFRSTRFGVPLDDYGRNVFVDTFDAAYGPGWRRENSFLTHEPTGGFCYGFYPHRGAPGRGTRYRATAIGPGVTPDVVWQGPAPGAYDPRRDAAANEQQRHELAGDRRCVVN